jgi:hypothetical protein
MLLNSCRKEVIIGAKGIRLSKGISQCLTDLVWPPSERILESKVQNRGSRMEFVELFWDEWMI